MSNWSEAEADQGNAREITLLSRLRNAWKSWKQLVGRRDPWDGWVDDSYRAILIALYTVLQSSQLCFILLK